MNDESVKDLMALLFQFSHPHCVNIDTVRDYLRDLVCTPFGGNRGKTAGWVVCVDGSPPKGILIVSAEGPDISPAYFLGRTNRISGAKQIETIQSFFDRYLRDTSEAFVLSADAAPASGSA